MLVVSAAGHCWGGAHPAAARTLRQGCRAEASGKVVVWGNDNTRPDGTVQLRLEPWGRSAGGALAVEVRSEVVGDSTARSQRVADIRWLLIATKAPATVAALESVSERLTPGAVLLLLSNGALALSEDLGALAILAKAHVVLGTTTHGAWSKDDFHVVHAGVGRTWFGRTPGSSLADLPYQEALERVEAAGLGAADAGEGILERLWLKLAASAVINPLTALWEVSNGEILRSEEGLAALHGACAEVAAVAAALADRRGGPPPPSPGRLRAFVHAVATETAGNRSSMLQDILAGRTTEIDFLSGWIASKGEQLRVPVPVSAELAARLREKQALGKHGTGAPCEGRGPS